MKKVSLAFFLALAASALLSACGTARLVHSDVTSFSRWTPAPPAPGAAYRFERLPSQQQPDAQQTQLEAIAQTALAKVGLQHNPPVAGFSVQIGASNQPIYRAGWGYDAYPYGGSSVFIGGGSGGGSIGFGFGFPMGGLEPPIYKRDVSIVIRELRSNTVVYETRASGDGPWQDSLPVLGAMFDSALLGFPTPPPGPRRVSIEIPR